LVPRNKTQSIQYYFTKNKTNKQKMLTIDSVDHEVPRNSHGIIYWASFYFVHEFSERGVCVQQ
jgi:hypothetical protein